MILSKDNYVEKAEKVILKLKDAKDQRGRSKPRIQTSKIRNLLAMTASIYNDVLNMQEEELNDEQINKIEYLKIRFIYESGRFPEVKEFVKEAQILEILKEMNKDRSSFILFNRYFEGLVAYHKFYDGKD